MKSGSEWSWHYPHHLFVLTQAFLLFSMTKLVSCVNCVPLLFPKSFRVFSWVICCIWCTKDQELIIVLKSGLISNPDQNGTRHNQNGTRQKVGTFMKIRRSPVSSDVRKAWRHNHWNEKISLTLNTTLYKYDIERHQNTKSLRIISDLLFLIFFPPENWGHKNQ